MVYVSKKSASSNVHCTGCVDQKESSDKYIRNEILLQIDLKMPQNLKLKFE